MHVNFREILLEWHSHSEEVRWGLRVCISNKLSDAADAASSQECAVSNKILYDLPSIYHLGLYRCDLVILLVSSLIFEATLASLIVLEYPGMHPLRSFALADLSVWKHFTPMSLFLPLLSSRASCLYNRITFLEKASLAI